MFRKAIGALGAAALIIGISGCDAFAPKIDVSKMTTADLEAQLAKGNNDAAIKLRLSEIYLLYGTDLQKAKAFEYLMPMAEAGVPGAAERMCPFVPLDEYSDAALPYCIAAAQAGSVRAQANVCVGIGLSTEDKLNGFCESPAKAGRADTYVFYGSNLAAEGRYDEAVEWIDRSIYEGPLDHRDLAVSLMVFAVQDNVEDNPYHYAYTAPDGMGYVDRFEEVAMPSPPAPSAVKRSVQCYVKFTVTPTGLAYRTEIECSHKSLDKPMAEAVHKWRFKPTTWASSTSFGKPEYIPIFDKDGASRVVQFDPK